jgi:dihydrofolate reductase
VKLVLVVAAATNGVIGAGNATPWRLPSDLKRFRELTWGKPLIMGRRTFESIGRALPGRETVVLSRDPAFRAPGAHSARNIEEARALSERLAETMAVEEIVVAGGAQVYEAFLPQADLVHLTEVETTVAGDAMFPRLSPREWREVARRRPPRATGDEADFSWVLLERARM